MILDNPFRLLGLPATAGSRDVRRRVEELTVKASLGTAAPGLDADALGRIRHSLEDPVQRLGHELFWLHSASERVDPALEIASGNGAVTAALADLRAQAGRPASRDQAIALHDLATLTFANYEQGPDESEPAEALGLWADLHGSDVFWEYLRQRAAEANDARLTTEVVQRARDDLPTRVLEPVSRRVSELVESRRFEAAADVLRSIRGSGFPAQAVEHAVQQAIAPLRIRVRDGASKVDQLVNAIPSSEGPTEATRKKLVDAERVLVERVLAPFALLKAVDPVFTDPAFADAAAASSRRLSVAVCNILEDWDWGYVLLRQAIETAQTPSYLSQLAGDQAQVRASLHHSEAALAAHRGQALIAAAHYELALPYARTDEERAEWSHLAAGARLSGGLTDSQVETQGRAIVSELERRETTLKARVTEAASRPPITEPLAAEEEKPALAPVSSRSTLPIRPRRHWGRWAAAGAAAAAIAGIAIAATHSGSSSPNTPSSITPAAPASASPDASGSASSADCSTIKSLGADIDGLKAQIAGKRRLLARINAQEAPVIAALTQIQNDYPSHQLPPDVYGRWSSLRRQYKALDNRANAAVRDGNALIRSYNPKVRTYNQLVKGC